MMAFTSAGTRALRSLAQAILLFLMLAGTSASAQDTKPTDVPTATPLASPGHSKTFGDWTAVRLDMNESKLCFAVARARSPSGQAAAPEAPVTHLHVSTWPEAGVKAEVSVRTAAALSTGTPAQLTIGGETFKLFTKQDTAFVDAPLDELKMLEAMKKGSQATFSAQATDGSVMKDTFSLSGFAAALSHVTQGCP